MTIGHPCLPQLSSLVRHVAHSLPSSYIFQLWLAVLEQKKRLMRYLWLWQRHKQELEEELVWSTRLTSELWRKEASDSENYEVSEYDDYNYDEYI